mmetsp:Transcript_45593/g.145204  ORF Transcript_45593/g.145204 Transcript_45593/m.145204 type:complete len:213 (+) Transcript_45593:686-1324(+)
MGEHPPLPFRIQRPHPQLDVENFIHLHVLQDLAGAGGADHEQLLAVGRGALHEDEEGLQNHVGESGADGDVFQQPLDIIQHHDAEGALVRVFEHLKDGVALGALGEADELVAGDNLHEGEAALDRDGGRDGGLARADGTLEDNGEHGGLVGRLDLLHEGPAGLDEVGVVLPSVDHAVEAAPLQRVDGGSECRDHLVQSCLEVIKAHLGWKIS